MTQLDEFFDYKNRFMEDILTDKDIVALINEDVPFEESKKLAYTQVFPYEYVPETIEHGQVFVCCVVDVQKSLNKTYLLPTIYVWVFAHKSKLRLPTGGVRTDILASKIVERMNGSRFYGLGELTIQSARRFAPMTDYNGKMLTFNATDFNRLNPTGQPIPSNRKRG